MDHGTDEGVGLEPDEIRADMRNTRAAISDKLERIEDRVTENVESVQLKVEETFDTVKNAVSTVKRSLQSHPWTLFGGAVLTGFVIRRMVSNRTRYIAIQGPPQPGHSTPEAKEPGAVNKAMTHFREQFGALEAAAIAGAGGLFGRIVQQAVPGIAPFLDRSRNGKH